MYKKTLSLFCLAIIFLASSCQKESHTPAYTKNLTAGVVEKEIFKGMSQDQVVLALGSPNIVTKDGSGTQTWIYDKIASEVSYTSSQGGIWLILAGVQGQRGHTQHSNKTLTVIIKFDEQNKVNSVTYHSSQF